MKQNRLSRRNFLMLSGAAMLGRVLDPFSTRRPAAATPLLVGRVTNSSLRAYAEPSFTAKRHDKIFYGDTLLSVYEEKKDGDPGPSQNPIWWRTDDGWVHSSLIQPVRNDVNQPILDVPKEGFLAEMTVPFSDAWRNDDGNPKKVYRFY